MCLLSTEEWLDGSFVLWNNKKSFLLPLRDLVAIEEDLMSPSNIIIIIVVIFGASRL